MRRLDLREFVELPNVTHFRQIETYVLPNGSQQSPDRELPESETITVGVKRLWLRGCQWSVCTSFFWTQEIQRDRFVLEKTGFDLPYSQKFAVFM